MKNTAVYLLESVEIPDKSILGLISKYDAAETLDLPAKWPRSFSTVLAFCPKCKKQLPPLVKKRQRNQTDKQLLISKHHIIEVEIFSRKCKSCCVIFRPDTFQHGLLNIGDTSLVTLDVFFTLRNTIRYFLTNKQN